MEYRPCTIPDFPTVTLYNSGQNCTVIAHADHWFCNLIPVCHTTKFIEHFRFGATSGQVKFTRHADWIRNCTVNQLILRVHTEAFQHFWNIVLRWTNVTMYNSVPLFKLLQAERFIILSVYWRGRIRRHAVEMLNGEKYDEPSKSLSKRQWENKFFNKIWWKAIQRGIVFFSGNVWKHITEMSAKVFLELTL